jgi:hypothetical protein
MNWKEPQTRPTAFVMRSWNFKEQALMIIAHEDEGNSWKENHGLQNIGFEDSTRDIVADKRHIWENHIMELYDRPNGPEDIEVEPEERKYIPKRKPLYFVK